ncbi:pilus assembly protein [Desulfobacula sp.]
MVKIKSKTQAIILINTIIFTILTGNFSLVNAQDTNIYQINTKQNCYILLDNSGSMDFGVYEQSIDYGEMFDYLFTLNDSGSQSDYIWDTITDSDYFYENHKETSKIFLWKGQIGVTIASVDGVSTAFTGDAADPNYLWYSADLVDTNTLIDSDGTLTYDGSGTQRLTTDADGHILFDGVKLPLNQDIKLSEMQTLYDGSQMDIGFGGLLNAPGYYFSGYENVGSLDTAEDGDQDIYFFVTGNWVNMQAMYNLHYTTNNPTPTGASTGDPAWKYELVSQSSGSWSELAYSLSYPTSGQYDNKLKESKTMQTITHPGATQIQVHFSTFDVDGDVGITTWKDDYVAIYNGDGSLVAQYDNDNSPTSGDGWSATINDDTAQIALYSDNTATGDGYTIDKIRVSYESGSYLMQNRLDVAKDALLYVIDEFQGKMNWGYASYQYNGTSGDGATINSALNPSLTDDQNRAAISNHVENESPQYGTPLGEALQDVFEKGYWAKRNALNNLVCRKNYIISVTDGFPSDDTDWNRISDTSADPYLPFSDWDGDGWTADPYQYSSPPPNYYDDVGHWMYTHSWDDKTLVTNPGDSYVNVTTHHIAFGADHPLLRDAADESGGEYVVAFNKEQLVAAFYALTLQMTEAVSFTSPVVSIDAVNKIQNGDDLYLGLFLPQDSQSWMGNIKKFKFGDGSSDRPDIWMLYDGSNNEAVNTDGEFLDNTSAFWADDTDSNDSDNYGSADVREDGVGEVLTERVAQDFTDTTYWDRPIYTYNTTLNSLLKIKYDTISAADLGVADDLTRDMVINYLYGYTYDADATTHAPSFVRDWALGSIVHSRPVVVDYYDPTSITTLLKRYVVVGSNDGMLHVFDDTSSSDADYGKEIFAFVPEDVLPNLQNISQNPFVDTVDGPILLYRSNNSPKYLIFGERRGGNKYWCLDVSDTNPLNWSVAWIYENSEIAQTWSEPMTATIPISLDTATGERQFKDVLIFTGGYDPEEDNYPEPFNDLDNSGSPYKTAVTIDTTEWDKNDAAQDINGNTLYDLYNLDKNEYGRGIYIVDIDNPSAITNDSSGNQILPFSVTYGAADTNDTNGAVQTLSSMKFCFPASPAVVTTNLSYLYKDSGQIAENIKTNVISTIYATDIYSNIFKISYNFVVNPDDLTNDNYAVQTNQWTVTPIFSGNPGSSSSSGQMGQGDDATDQGRKTFYPPAISWGGSCSYFDAGNYYFTNTQFLGINKIASLYFGTGDREHPTYTLIKNRFYAIYDDSSVSAIQDPDGTPTAINVTSVPYKEDDLLNLSCDELDLGTTLTTLNGITKNDLQEILRDDPSYNNYTLLENGAANEDDAKGWYIVLEDQGDATECSHCTYSGTVEDTTTISRDNHDGEKILSKVNLYSGILYFTSYQPSISDPCNPQGNGLAYSLNYCDGTAGYNLNTLNDSGTDDSFDVTDRYHKVINIFGIPSDFAIVTRKGQAGAMSMMGGDIIGPKGQSDFTIKGPGYGLELYYWREGNSQN